MGRCHSETAKVRWVPTRAEHRRQTLRSLSDAAVTVMEREGPDVSLDVVAAQAGVSRRTIYRWVDAREDLVFIHPRLWLEEFDGAVGECADEALVDRLRAGCRAVCDIADRDPEPVRRAMRLAAAHPELMRGYGDVNQAWIERLAREVDPAPGTRSDRLRAHTVGAATMGAIDAALTEWAAAGDGETLGELVGAALDHLDPLLRSI